MSFLSFIRSIVTKQPEKFVGAVLDNRSEEEKKENDVTFGEIVANAAAVPWEEKPLTSLRSFEEFDQKKSMTCGANALAKSLGVMFFNTYGVWLKFSRPDIYQRRVNKGAPGMMFWDMFRIGAEGVTLEMFTPAKLETDADYDGVKVLPWMRDIGKTFAFPKGILIPSDIETVASVISVTKKAPILLTYFTSHEWSMLYPKVINSTLKVDSDAALRHYVVATDFVLIWGKRYLKIEDSAHFGEMSVRYLDESWVARRCFEIRYPMNFKFAPNQGSRPSYDGMTVVSLQECLRFEGVFPANVSFVENLGPMTKDSIVAFQKKYNLKQERAITKEVADMLRKLYP